MKKRSLCPINQAVEIFGDKWTLLIIRDILFEGKNTYREFLQSKEGIASNILADRLSMMEAEGILVKKSDPGHKQKIIYTLTEKGIDILPVIVEMGMWSAKYKKIGSKDKGHVKLLKEGGEAVRNEIKKQFMLKLKE